MGITLELPPELAKLLAAEARQRGLSVADYVLQLLTRDPRPTMTCKTGGDLVAYWQSEGLIGTRADIADASEHARNLRRQAETRNGG